MHFSTGCRLTNATNIGCHYVDENPQKITFFINLRQMTNPKLKGVVALCRNGVVEGLPLEVTCTAHYVRPASTLDKGIAEMQSFQGSRQIDATTWWSMEGEMLRLDVDLSQSPHPAGPHLVKFTSNLCRAMTVALEVSLQPNATWPPQTTTPQRDVACQLQFGSPTPPDASPTPTPDAAPLPPPPLPLPLPPLTPPLLANDRSDELLRSDLDGELVAVGDSVITDSRDPRAVTITFFPKKSGGGNLVMTEFPFYGKVIGARLTISLNAPETSLKRVTTRPKKKPAGRDAVNLSVAMSNTPDKCIIITFDSEQRHGPLDINKMVGINPPPGAEVSLPQLISDGKVQCGEYTIDFTASRAPLQIPSETEIYLSVHNYLTLSADGGSAGNVDMEGVRRYVHSAYRYMDKAVLDEMQEFQLRIWGCVRLFAYNRALGKPFSC